MFHEHRDPLVSRLIAQRHRLEPGRHTPNPTIVGKRRAKRLRRPFRRVAGVKAVATADANVNPAVAPKVTYTIARVNDPLAPQVRAVTGLGSPDVDPVVVLVNLPKDASFFRAKPASSYDAAAIAAFVQGWREESIVPTRLDLEAGAKRAQANQAQAQEKAKSERVAKLQALIQQLQQGAQAGDPNAVRELKEVFKTLQKQGLPAEAIAALAGPNLTAGLPAAGGVDASGAPAGEYGTRAAAAAAAAGGGLSPGAGADAGAGTFAQTTAGVVAKLRGEASDGDPSAMRDLAMIYLQGKGAPKDLVESIKWATLGAKTLEPRAKGGDLKAMTLCADCLVFLQRDEEAYAWWCKAAALGSKASEYQMALCLQGGRGAPQDLRKAAIMLRTLKRRANDQDPELAQVGKSAANALNDKELAAALVGVELREDAVVLGGISVLAAVAIGVYWVYFKK